MPKKETTKIETISLSGAKLFLGCDIYLIQREIFRGRLNWVKCGQTMRLSWDEVQELKKQLLEEENARLQRL